MPVQQEVLPTPENFFFFIEIIVKELFNCKGLQSKQWQEKATYGSYMKDGWNFNLA